MCFHLARRARDGIEESIENPASASVSGQRWQCPPAIRMKAVERHGPRIRHESSVSDRISDHGYTAFASEQKPEGKGEVEAESGRNRQGACECFERILFY
jgi:hypothetical protein